MGKKQPVQSVDRAVRILKMLAQNELTVSEIAFELGVHVSTASRLVSGLRAHELVERSETNGHLRLGVGLLRLAGATVTNLDLAAHAQPVCDALASEVGETTNVAILDGDGAINVCQAQGTGTIAMQNWVGQRTVLHATSSGKILLAYADQRHRETLLRPPLEKFTELTLAKVADIEAELTNVLEVGWAQAIEEYEEGLNAIAAPIRSHDGRVIGALSAAGPAYRLSPDRLPEAVASVIRAADEISSSLGFERRLVG